MGRVRVERDIFVLSRFISSIGSADRPPSTPPEFEQSNGTSIFVIHKQISALRCVILSGHVYHWTLKGQTALFLVIFSSHVDSSFIVNTRARCVPLFSPMEFLAVECFPVTQPKRQTLYTFLLPLASKLRRIGDLNVFTRFTKIDDSFAKNSEYSI